MNTFGKVAMVAVMITTLGACSAQDQRAGTLGAATGAVIGGLGSGTLEGAAVGAAVGAGAGILIGRVLNSDNDCYYRDRRGRRYVARCR